MEIREIQDVYHVSLPDAVEMYYILQETPTLSFEEAIDKLQETYVNAVFPETVALENGEDLRILKETSEITLLDTEAPDPYLIDKALNKTREVGYETVLSSDIQQKILATTYVLLASGETISSASFPTKYYLQSVFGNEVTRELYNITYMQLLRRYGANFVAACKMANEQEPKDTERLVKKVHKEIKTAMIKEKAAQAAEKGATVVADVGAEVAQDYFSIPILIGIVAYALLSFIFFIICMIQKAYLCAILYVVCLAQVKKVFTYTFLSDNEGAQTYISSLTFALTLFGGTTIGWWAYSIFTWVNSFK